MLVKQWSRAVWFGSGKAFWIMHKEITAVDKWLEDILYGCLSKETTKEGVGTLFQICWGIWKARNNYVFEKKNPKPEEVIERTKKDVVDYLQAVCRKVQRLPAGAARLGRWVAPPPSILKINCDGAFKSPRSLAAFGIIVRDNGGSAQLWRCGRVLVYSALAIEAWAFAYSLYSGKGAKSPGRNI
ncbi:uncharacterized protein LOC131304667 [Rhododendron vialii]|uniref:uncharacterized protein LOC131304667 n=1 Tax=Rhododendron vialii TaxID=182163 RepID=UPI00265DF0BA|nr:uncharacterized protein LOC131304667 [Rhododendron vialii]